MRTDASARGRRAAAGAVLGLVASLAAVVVVGAACAAPTLPLPPPATPTVTVVGQGRYLLKGERSASPGAIVVIYNRDPAVSLADRVDATEADREGTWSQEISAQPDSLVDIWQEVDSSRSPPITVKLPSK